MADLTLLILFIALVADWYLGEPKPIWSRLPHPIVLFGKAVQAVDDRLNITSDDNLTKYRKGALGISLLVLLGLFLGWALEFAIASLSWIGFLIEAFIVFVLLAQRSLFDHVMAVASGLRQNGLEGGREAVGLIVGRDVSQLDRAGVCRAAIESLAENFSDGVVAPAFWYAIFGLPGLIIYKLINTADSMIAYKSEKYLWFGKATAHVDDLANWLPARISAFLIAGGVWLVRGRIAARASLSFAFQSSGLHRSPNAGWPESAMAGGAGFALGGPRIYPHETVWQAWINATGKRNLNASDIEFALKIFSAACYVLWIAVAVVLLI